MTKSLLKSALLLLGFALGTCVTADALAFVFPKKPEIDPSLAVSAFTLLAGSLAVLRARSKNKK
jgi:hypothetical protein